MPKDTKSSGNNKAPACESRGFGHKKEGENFDTPSFLNLNIDSKRIGSITWILNDFALTFVDYSLRQRE